MDSAGKHALSNHQHTLPSRNLSTLSDMNDAKKRRDFAIGNGINNPKLFVLVSELVNDGLATELNVLTLVHTASDPGSANGKEEEDEHVLAAIQEDGIYPKQNVRCPAPCPCPPEYCCHDDYVGAKTSRSLAVRVGGNSGVELHRNYRRHSGVLLLQALRGAP